MNNKITEITRNGVAFPMQNVGSTEVGGTAIVMPWQYGQKILFSVLLGAMTTSDAMTITLQKRRVGTSTWDDMNYPTAFTTPVTMAGTAFNDGGLYENGAQSALGELDLSRLKRMLADDPGSSYTYDAIRLEAVNAVSQNVLVGATYQIAQLSTYGSPDSDRELWFDAYHYPSHQ